MLEIEIVESNIIDGGVEVFARAWRDGKQIGFGKDGSVDVERFRIFNPPILVPDPNGDIESVSIEPISQVQTIKRFREDPEEALLQVLEHNIAQVGKDGSKIVDGKVGNTTSTFYPSSDGAVGSRNSTFTNVRNGVNLFVNTTSNGIVCYVGVGYYAPGGSSCNSDRGFLVFNTSAIDSGDTLDSATLSLTAQFKNNADNSGYDYIAVVESNLDNGSYPTTGDWDSGGSVEGSNQIDMGSITANNTTYHDFTLNATGEGWVNFGGTTQFCLKSGDDIQNHQPSNQNRVGFNALEYSGTSSDPKLVIVHSAGGGGATANNSARRQHFMMM